MTKTYIKTIIPNGKEYRALNGFKRISRHFKTATEAQRYAARWKTRYVSLKLAAIKPKAEPAEEEKLSKCAWERVANGNFEASCGHVFSLFLIVDEPKENQIVYCPFCGRISVIVDHKPQGDIDNE
jgi:hypothetical protein